MTILNQTIYWTWWEWIGFSILVNVLLFAFSVGLFLFIEKTCSKADLQTLSQPMTRADMAQSVLTIFCNSVVMIAGVALWKNGWIQLSTTNTFVQILVQAIVLVLVMDLLMYWFHRLAHIPHIYQLLHCKHHEHTSTNCLSLFVLHPLETLGFGAMILVLLMCYDFSAWAIVAYLFINLVWGTIGHLNKEFFPPNAGQLYIGTSQFHNQHHLHEHQNFGFYTSVWDKLFRTYHC